MFKVGDIIERNDDTEGFSKGTLFEVAGVVDHNYIKLKGMAGHFLQSRFVLHKETQGKHKISSASILEVMDALKVIDNWNRTHPTALMISITAAPTQDGGSEFELKDDSSNSLDEFHDMLIQYSDEKDAMESLNRAMKLLQRQQEK